jgi:hypothetical protein
VWFNKLGSIAQRESIQCQKIECNSAQVIDNQDLLFREQAVGNYRPGATISSSLAVVVNHDLRQYLLVFYVVVG